MGGSVVADIFFVATDGWFAEISHIHGSQYNIICNHHLWQYPGVIPGVLSKRKVCPVWYHGGGFFDFNRDFKGVCFYHIIPIFFIDKTGSDNILYVTWLCSGRYYVLSLVFRIAIAYFTLKQQTEEILLQKSQAELNLLKSQVQPHFLFNALNSIYYRVYKVDPPSAALIERLSDIMRYFVDESPKDEVPVATEVAFIENYMALERIRIRYGATVNFEKAYNPELRIPPMLLMTFVENIFKHGIDKSRKQNRVTISLVQQNDHLLFKTSNHKIDPAADDEPGGFGIINLTKRLRMLYGDRFELTIDNQGELFTAFLKIPL
jgi:hypothetical protein